MTNKTKSTDDIYDDNAEASRKKGVVRKGTPRPPPAGKVKVTHNRKGLGLAILDKVQVAYITLTGSVGMFQIYTGVSDPTIQAHAMWAFGIATVTALLASLIRKRE